MKNLAHRFSFALPLFLLASEILSLQIARAHQLTSDQIAVLSEFQSLSQFPVHVLEKTVDGVPRTLVLLGEIHVVPEPVSSLAEKLVKTFEWIGAEGIPSDPVLEGELQTSYWLGSLFISGAGGSPGVIAQAQNRFHSQLGQMSVTHQLALKIIYGLEEIPPATQVNQMSPEGKELFLQIGYGADAAVGDSSELKARTRDYLKQQGVLELTELESLEPMPATYYPWRDQYVSGMQMLKSGCKWGACLAGGLIAAKAFGWDKASYFGIGAGVLGGAAWVKNAIAKSKELVKSRADMLRGRDEVMARQMSKAFESRKRSQVLLALVGRDHVPGILSLLDQAEFVEVLWKPESVSAGAE